MPFHRREEGCDGEGILNMDVPKGRGRKETKKIEKETKKKIKKTINLKKKRKKEMTKTKKKKKKKKRNKKTMKKKKVNLEDGKVAREKSDDVPRWKVSLRVRVVNTRWRRRIIVLLVSLLHDHHCVSSYECLFIFLNS